jgi:hypothetical protein
MIHFAKLRKAADGDPAVVALVGSSRVRYGLSPAALDRAVPGRRFLQLGILGNGALPVLRDLAADPNFHGRVICEFNPAHWNEVPRSAALPDALAFTYPEYTLSYLETFIAEHLREHFSFAAYNFVTEVPRILQHKPVPEPESPDRAFPFRDLGPAVNEHLIDNWMRSAENSASKVKGADSLRAAQQVYGWTTQIRRRGGDVAFVRMPVDGRLRVREDELLPQTQPEIRDIRALGMLLVDYAEMPEHFRCPDGSHLDAPEADRFSRSVAQSLAAKGFFR